MLKSGKLKLFNGVNARFLGVEPDDDLVRGGKWGNKGGGKRKKMIPPSEVDGVFDSPDSLYYRWRVFSFLQGDSRSHWRD